MFNGRLTHTNYRQVSTVQQKYQRENNPFKTVGHAAAGNNSHHTTQRVCFPRNAADNQQRFLAVKMKSIHPKFILPFGILIWYFSKVVDMSQPKKLWLTWDNLKGLSHEIDFKNFDKNLQNLA
jgi:hypothetical protein